MRRQPPAMLETAGRRILVVMATEAEYGPALQARLKPVITGVGPVEAAIGTARALEACLDLAALPDLVLSLGSAGSATLEQGAVYQASSVSYRDMDASPLGITKGVTPFMDHPPEIPLPVLLKGVPSARLSSGANIVSGSAYAAIDADMVDMESFAVYRACTSFGVPMIGLRGISDGAKELHHYDDWTALLGHLDVELAGIIDRLPEILLRQ
ncbi:MAG: 5'-methylthioadenosine/S-adenosylhomocysteine nucleosidase [Proteobacteria bacterium]|nr:5'-methylthioadenosine/S-adenosylhomocysteine nucleosidase [Pseudomonadota bacterium]